VISAAGQHDLRRWLVGARRRIHDLRRMAARSPPKSPWSGRTATKISAEKRRISTEMPPIWTHSDEDLHRKARDLTAQRRRSGPKRTWLSPKASKISAEGATTVNRRTSPKRTSEPSSLPPRWPLAGGIWWPSFERKLTSPRAGSSFAARPWHAARPTRPTTCSSTNPTCPPRSSRPRRRHVRRV